MRFALPCGRASRVSGIVGSQKIEDPKQHEDSKQNADPVVKPPSSKPTHLAADSNAAPKIRKATSSSSPEAIPPEVGESNQQVKQPQPEANAKSSSDEPAKMDTKAGAINADSPQGQTGSRRTAPGAVGGDPVKVDTPKHGARAASQPGSKRIAPTEEAPTKQVAQLHQLLDWSFCCQKPVRKANRSPTQIRKYSVDLLVRMSPMKRTWSSKVNLPPSDRQPDQSRLPNW